VAHHRVERVDRAVGGQPGQPGYRAPQQRRHHRVGGVLRHGLDHGPRYLGGIQAGRVAAAQAGQNPPRGGQVVAGQSNHGPFGLMM
jgi:hypothetical protein